MTNFYYVGNDQTQGAGQLYHSDSAATQVISFNDHNPYLILDLRNVNGNLLFSGYSRADSSFELYVSDGTAAGTRPLTKSAPHDLTVSNGLLFFTMSDLVNGTELWASDGTAAGTHLVKDIDYGGGSSSPASLEDVDGTLFFTADDSIHGSSFWKSDGTERGTVPVASIPDPTPTEPSNELDGYTYFGIAGSGSNDPATAPQLWRTNGAGTSTEVAPVPGLDQTSLAYITNIDGIIYFGANGIFAPQLTHDLWRSDGSSAGTYQIGENVGSPLVAVERVLTVHLANDTGVPDDRRTADPALVGTAAPNATVTFSEGANALGAATADASGDWSFTPKGLGTGDHTISARQTDLAGHVVTIKASFDLTPAAPANSDFDYDGTSDLLWQNAIGQACLWSIDNGAQSDGNLVGANPGANWHVMAIADFNGDGHSDMLWQDDNGQPAVWLMNGSTVLDAATVDDNPGPEWRIVGASDLNNDGKSDILFQNTDGRVHAWLMDGLTKTGSDEIGSNPGPEWHVAGSGTFNHDNSADILFQNDNGQAHDWYLNGLTKTGGDDIGSNPGPDWKLAGTGDFNGDGTSDLIWQNIDGRAAIWLLDPDGATVTFASVIGNPGPEWHVKGTGDYNNDSKSDILWQNDSGQAAIWLMNGTSQTAGMLVGSNPGPEWQVIA